MPWTESTFTTKIHYVRESHRSPALMYYSCYIFLLAQSLLDQLAAWAVSTANVHAHSQTKVFDGEEFAQYQKWRKREKRTQNVSPTRLLCISTKCFSTCKPVPAHLHGLNIDRGREEGAGEWKWESETSHAGMLSDHLFRAEFSNYCWVTRSVANGEGVGAHFAADSR